MPASLSPRYLVALTAVFIAAVFIFAGVYTATQHKPVPHQLRVGVVGPQDAVLKMKAGLNLQAPGYFKLIEYTSADDLKTAIKDRKVYGGYVQEATNGLLITASASGKVSRDTLVLVATELTNSVNMPLKTEDLVPLGKGDTSGLSSYTFQYGLLVPSFFFGLLLFMFAHGASLYWRLGLTAVYAVGAGILGALTVDQIVGALPGHFAALAGLGILYAAMAVLVTYGLSALMGYLGAALAGLALILVGNSVGGGSINQEFLPNTYRDLGQVFPNGAFIRTVRDTVYFGGHNTNQSIMVVSLWAVGGLVLVLLAGPVRALVARPEPAKAAPAKAAPKRAAAKKPAPRRRSS
jgi:hypothetical protein